ncbi:immunoglobulin superfamily member 3-like isoform X1 [Scleropages formosus]|uniref:immunoglobulin superfamily member 3-like isoform X1 n=1 Tax=Scleropages formosus TaxID=113540 RepID=UPI0010FAA944|nr:immunoglobulin superfamily member 3-like isoform X1 [Scleropages formosus]
MTGKPQVSHFLLSVSEMLSGSCDRSGSRAVWTPRDRMDRPGRLFRKLLLLCLSASVHWDTCQCQQEVQINEPPLFRAQGSPLTISCTVINSRSSHEQQFDFVIYKKSAPERMVNIISTGDPSFPYADYSKRVRNGDIEVERLSSFSVLLHMKELLKEDDGDFECQTPNQLGTYLGSYSAKTTVNVIADTLSVSSTATDVTKTEGESLVFECQMSTQTFQHTHLSLTWYLQGESDSQVQPIISLDKDLTVRPGKAFESRYTSGFISVDKVDETTYKLEISKLQVTDQGKISCEGSEWIQDPDRSWYRLGQKNVTVSSVQVQPLIVDPNMDSFSVQVESPKGGVREGEVLQLKCTVEAQKIQERYFSVAWLKDGREVAHMDPRGVVSISQEYEARDREGEMKVWKSSNRDYVLFIKPVRVMDTGEYQCRVWKEEKGTGGVFTQGRSQDSSVERVAVTVPESNLVVTVPSAAVSVTQGSLLQLACQVSGAKGQVSVAWQHRSDKGTTVDVINLSRSGVMEPGAQYRQRVQAGNVRALRPTASNFTLEIANVLLTDSGVYRCTATDWVTERDDKVKNIDSKLQESTVSVVSLDSIISASLKSRNVRVTENDTVELICTVKRPEAPLSVTWKFQPTGTPSQADIVLLTHNGDITWFKELRNYQLRVQAQAEETRVVLRIMRASASEAGAYQCVVDAFLQQVQTSRKLSNKLSVIVSRPESSLSIATGPQPLLEHDANSDVRMECRILKATSNSSRFAVTWQLQRPGEKNQTVVSMDHDSVLSDPGEAERYSLRRHDAQLFELLVPRVETRDSGQYHCLVEEWLQNSHGVWYSLPAKSDALELVVRSKRSGLSLLKSNLEVSTAENEQVNVNCTMEAGSALPSSHYSVTWFFAKVNASAKETLGKVGHDGVLDTSGLAPELLERIRFYRPAIDTFSLTIQRVCVEDGGEYSCEVAEYQTDRDGNVMYIGSSKSGITNVRVLLPDPSSLHSGPSGTTVTLIILALLVVILVIVVLVLSRKLQHQSATLKKKSASLWMDGKPLTPNPEEE